MIARQIRRSFITSTGLVMSRKNKQAALYPFEGPLELAFYVVADFDPLVESIAAQPFEITYHDRDGKPRSYFPDTLVHFRKDLPAGRLKRPLLVEVKKQESIASEGELHQMQTEAGNHFAAGEGMDYRVFSERDILTPYWRNAKFLRRFEIEPPVQAADKDGEARLLTLFGPPKEHRVFTIDAVLTRAVCEGLGGDSNHPSFDTRVIELMPCLYRLIRRSVVFVDLSQPLLPTSPVWAKRATDTFYSFFA